MKLFLFNFVVNQTVKDFWALISDLPDSAKEAPAFAKLFPNIPPAFDNNHMLHDIVSDILTSDAVPTISLMRSEGIRLGRMAQDSNAFKSNFCGN